MPNAPVLPSAEGLTNEQKQAVYAENPRLLVSAAAGSGKTRVLIERILHLVAAGKIKLDRMLIVTFTRAAAGEMRSRLESGLAAACELTNLPPETMANLQEGSLCVHQAQISTIHSFCQKVVKQHFDLVDVDPQFTILDSRMKEQVFEESMAEALEALYECADSDANPEKKSWAAALTSRFTGNEIAEMMEKLYAFIIARPNPEDWLQLQIRQDPSQGSAHERIQAVAMKEMTNSINEGICTIERMQVFTRMHGLPQAYEKMLEQDSVYFHQLLEAAAQGPEALKAKLHMAKPFVQKPSFTSKTSDEEAADELLKKTRDYYKKIVSKLAKELHTDNAWDDLYANVPAVKGLCYAMLRFLHFFRGHKQELAQIDFSDVEHMTLQILRNEERCAVIRSGYDAVFVDECQDISRLQEELLTRLCPEGGETSIFYVGDVKQSIYRFRQACPGLFLEKLKTFSNQPDALSRSICLNENFRSRDEVISMVNRVFNHLMKPELTEIDYRDHQQLLPAPGAEGGPCAEIHILYKKDKNVAEARQAEANFIAEDICRRLKRGEMLPAYKGKPERPMVPGDIAILAPSIAKVRPLLEKAFAKAERKLEIKSVKNADALDSMEVQLTLQFLSLLCNVRNDTAVATVLRSPLFDFTDEELAQIRLTKPDDSPFYEAVRKASEEAEEPLRTKLGCALNTLQDERRTMLAMSTGAYLWDFLRRSGLFALAGASGNSCQANLCALCERAYEFDQNGQGGMQDFVESMLVERNSESDMTPGAADGGNAVRLMTIHGSKGLQYPVVYCMLMGDELSKGESSAILQQDEELGLAMEYRNPDLRIKRNTILQNCIQKKEAYANRAERARVLYVAMTRAEQKLILSGADSEIHKNLQVYLSGQFVNCENADDRVLNAKTYMNWIVDCLRPTDEIWAESEEGWTKDGIHFAQERPFCQCPAHPEQWQVSFHLADLYLPDENREEETQETPGAALPEYESFRNTDAPDVIPKSLCNEKENAIRQQAMPQKVGVTALCEAIRQTEEEKTHTAGNLNELAIPRLGDENAPHTLEETAENKRWPLEHRHVSITDVPDQPEFLIGKLPVNAATERGVQTHRALSLIALDRVKSAIGNPVEIHRIVSEECERIRTTILLEEETPYLDERMVQRFYADDIARRMLLSPEVHREWRFAMRMTEPFETVLQGVVDLCFLEDDEWVLVDYKTDRVTNAEDLWESYGRQLEYYKTALEALTGHRVKQMALFSLRLGVCSFRK